MTDKHDQIDFEEPTYNKCECCGARTTELVRFVSRDDSAFAVYKAAFSDTPDHDYVSLIAGFGDWGEDSPADERIAFACRLWVHENNFNVGVIEPDESYWRDTKILGRVLPRSEALQHPMLEELFDLTDHIVVCDQPVIEFLNRANSADA